MARLAVVAIFLLLFQTSCSFVTLQTIKKQRIVDKIYNSTVLLATSFKIDNDEDDSEIKAASASGVIVRVDYDKNISYALTVKHFCEAPVEYDIELSDAKYVAYSQLSLKDDDYKTYDAFVFYVDKTYDLCVVAITGIGKLVPIAISKQDVQLGEHVTTIGAPNLIYPVKFDGYVVTEYGGKACTDCIIVGVTSSEGSSGSAVYNDDYELVGIIIGVNRANDNISIMASLSSINIALKQSLLL